MSDEETVEISLTAGEVKFILSCLGPDPVGKEAKILKKKLSGKAETKFCIVKESRSGKFNDTFLHESPLGTIHTTNSFSDACVFDNAEDALRLLMRAVKEKVADHRFVVEEFDDLT